MNIRVVLLLMKDTRSYLKESASKIYSHELPELLFVQPYCRIASLVESDIAKRQAASEYLKRLVEPGVLT